VRQLISIVLALVLAQAGAAWADQDGSIQLRTIAEVEVQILNEDGDVEIKRVEAAKVIPGDEVIYTIQYTNLGEQPAEDVVITDAIPEHMTYQAGSASGESTVIRFSVDGGKTYRAAGDLTVMGSDGQSRPATAADYTHIEWALQGPLAPTAEGSVSFRALLQ
jgi:uncharacterized repeat protein (TIGR01451 family)